MMDPRTFIEAALQRGFKLWTGVPCSYLGPLIDCVTDTSGVRHVLAANEGDAVAVAAGAWLGGTRAGVYMQNSGLGNAVSPLTSLTHVFDLPVLLLVTRRGGPRDEPQHALMGDVTTGLLDLMQISWQVAPREPDALGAVLDGAVASLIERRRPFALIVEKGTFAPHVPSAPDGALHNDEQAPPPASLRLPAEAPRPISRAEALQRIRALTKPDDIFVASTGYTGRQLYALGDTPNQLYMVGSMGCASSLALGLAIAQPHRRVVVIDGDGALLMRLGACAAIGRERPPNLAHVVLDNGQHESTGGQASLSPTVDLPAVAAACGYPAVSDNLSCLREDWRGPLFIYVATVPGVPDGLPRPTITPAQVASRLRGFVGARD